VSQAARYLVRPDASTFHTFYMDIDTGQPRHGSTHQGFSDDSCWARGQAWGIAGFALAYRYHRDPALTAISRKLAHYFLNRLPDDWICYWDLAFTRGAQPRDSSAAAIAACGLLELAESLPATDLARTLYEKAAWAIVRQLSAYYSIGVDDESNGLLAHAVYHMPDGVGVDECCIWGDYFYLEALMRLSRAWTPYW
jgi:unsaturated chondroitin disaccharide hydrolase